MLKRFLSRANEIVEHVSQKENLLSAKRGESVRLKIVICGHTRTQANTEA